jgi:predicted transglutaminase-like protease
VFIGIIVDSLIMIVNSKIKSFFKERIKIDIQIQHNRPDLLVYDKKRKVITLIKGGIANLDILSQVENRKYEL